VRSLTMTALALAVMLPQSALGTDCENAMSQSDMTACADQAFEQSEAKLDAVYAEEISDLAGDDERTELLLELQSAWRAFRDAECAVFAMDSLGGSIYPMEVAQCQKDMTDERIAHLRGEKDVPETEN
jgi:uncharacterized protein YecT (DUF1311 family)